MELIQPLLAIAFVFGLLGVFVWRFGRVGPLLGARRDADAIDTAARMRLTPQHSLHVVSAAGRRWLVACHPGGVTMLAELDGREPAVARKSGAAA